jgi:hypothetical protein
MRITRYILSNLQQISQTKCETNKNQYDSNINHTEQSSTVMQNLKNYGSSESHSTSHPTTITPQPGLHPKSGAASTSRWPHVRCSSARLYRPVFHRIALGLFVSSITFIPYTRIFSERKNAKQNNEGGKIEVEAVSKYTHP